MPTRISGVVENVIYSNSETLFTVLDLDVDGELVCVVGEMSLAVVGEELIVYGEYVNHPTYGVQFKASAVEINLPTGSTAILSYLSSGAIEGIGVILARRIVEEFKDETLEVIDKTPERLQQIKGISLERALAIGRRFKEIFGIREMVSELSKISVSAHDAIRLYKEYGDRVSEMIRDNPYILSGFPLFKDFAYSDRIALSLSIEYDSEKRIRAAIIYILKHNSLNGHTCSPAERLIDKTKEFLGLERDRVEIVLWDAVEQGYMEAKDLYGTMFIFIPQLYLSERYISERILFASRFETKTDIDVEKTIDDFEQKNDIVYEPLQRQAIKCALTNGALVITGGPGTGKTTALNAIISICEALGESVAIAAPTGRAAKRIAELTNKEAKTIHRLLEVDYRKEQEIRFIHHEENQLKHDMIIIDEMSMVDVLLFESLLKGLRPQCRLVMVGDSNQLPAVGAGNLLQDIIDSGCCEVVEFQRIFRQAATSGIVVEAHNIVAGRIPNLEQRDTNFFFIEADEGTSLPMIADLCTRRLPKKYSVDPFLDIQVLTPSRIGPMGTESLNTILGAAINPSRGSKSELTLLGRRFRQGDKVMQTRNNYDIEYFKSDGDKGVGVFNGDIGRIVKIDSIELSITVEFDDDRKVKYTAEESKELEVAYAVTVHKSQGSEYPIVVLAVYGTPKRLRYRNLLYTAVTRARDILIILGDEKIIFDMVNNDKKALRYTGLESFISEAIDQKTNRDES